MGASAGAGSIMHQISAYGGTGEKLFKRAIPIGPGFFPIGGHSGAENSYLSLQAATNCMMPEPLRGCRFFFLLI